MFQSCALSLSKCLICSQFSFVLSLLYEPLATIAADYVATTTTVGGCVIRVALFMHYSTQFALSFIHLFFPFFFLSLYFSHCYCIRLTVWYTFCVTQIICYSFYHRFITMNGSNSHFRQQKWEVLLWKFSLHFFFYFVCFYYFIRCLLSFICNFLYV